MSAATARREISERYAFLSYGHSTEWMAVALYLQRLGLHTKCYELDPGVGGTICQNIENLVAGAEVSIIVMSGDDEMSDGKRVPRQSVIHELGLSQGKLGLNRTIVLKEECVDVFTNMQGVVYIEFATGDVKSTFPKLNQTLQDLEVLQAPRLRPRSLPAGPRLF